jgi:ribosomal protein S18 acetylase RimI-like enzyme
LDDFIVIEKLDDSDEVPFHLLLLADETMAAINKYLYISDTYIAKEVFSQQVIGAFVLQKINAKEIEIKNIAVDEAFQGQGIGSFLLDKIKQISVQHGAQILWVGAPDCAIRQLNFYRRNGFRKAGLRIDFFHENYPEPIYENGILLRDMLMLQIILTTQNDATKTEFNHPRR